MNIKRTCNLKHMKGKGGCGGFLTANRLQHTGPISRLSLELSRRAIHLAARNFANFLIPFRKVPFRFVSFRFAKYRTRCECCGAPYPKYGGGLA